MRDLEVADPYVERLLEGFAFRPQRIQLKMDAEFPILATTVGPDLSRVSGYTADGRGPTDSIAV